MMDTAVTLNSSNTTSLASINTQLTPKKQRDADLYVESLQKRHDELAVLSNDLDDPSLSLAKRNGDTGVKIACNMINMSEALLDIESILTQEQKETRKVVRSMTVLKNGIVETFQGASQIAVENDKYIVEELNRIPAIAQNKDCARLLIELSDRHSLVSSSSAMERVEEVAGAQANTLAELKEKLSDLAKEESLRSTPDAAADHQQQQHHHNLEVAAQKVTVASRLWAVVKAAALVSLNVVGPTVSYGIASTVLHSPATEDLLKTAASTAFYQLK